MVCRFWRELKTVVLQKKLCEGAPSWCALIRITFVPQ